MTGILNTVLKDNPELQAAVAQAMKCRGDDATRRRKEAALLRHTSNLHSSQRVVARGQWYGDEYHYPAVLVYKRDTDSVVALIPADDDVIEERPAKLFHLNASYTSIAQEALNNTTVSISS